MASTSLRRQVEALRNASSGTSSGYIQRKKGRPSLLLTPDQAADVDLSSVRETAVMGLQRLEAVDQDFSPFQGTLFSKEAEGTLRDLQTKESNERIDKSITSFLALLSPHFSSREAHFCLEYLIRHYKIYQYNVDAVVECCLPWHDTVAFARMVQLLSLKGSRWEFLTPVQKTGSPLPREAIARRCARDFALLRFLCVSARRAAAAAAESSSRQGGSGGGGAAVSAATAAGRAKLFSFYAAVVVEALASLGSASEPLLRALVPTVVHGLSATRSPEYQMASYMILSALSGKGPLSREVTNAALTALVCKPCQGGMEPSLLCALAIAQTQVGFASKKDSSGPGPLLLPTPAFQRLSGVESLPSVLARLAKEFDATAFLWLLLQSYVQHLPDEDGAEHCASLTRLCAYPHWPSHSLPRLVRRLVDRVIKTCLTVDEEGAADGAADESEDAQERVLRATRMKTETREVLRVLGQRFPQDVDAAVAKLSKYIARSKSESAAAAAAAALEEEGVEDVDVAKTARREARREETLSSLLVSTFAGADLAARLPLQPEADASFEGNQALQSMDSSAPGIHASLMVALEHPSGTVRARAVEQLSKAVSEAAGAVGGNDGSPGGQDDDLTAAVLRRLYDEDPEVVLAVTGSDTLLQRVLLRPTPTSPGGDQNAAEVVEESAGGGSSVSSRAAAVSSAAFIAATPWLSALSQARPSHPVPSVGRVLCGLLRVASAAVAATGERAEGSLPVELEEEKTREAAARLMLECLPGPHANARVRLARRACAAFRDAGGGSSGKADDAADAAAGRACKKAVRAVGRAAVEAVCGLGESPEGSCLGVFDGVGEALSNNKAGAVQGNVSSSGKKKGKGKEGDAMDVDGGKSKGLKEMGEELWDALAAGFSAGDKTEQIQALGETSDAAARWLLLECVSRAVPLAAANDGNSDDSARRLASLLARLATFELRLRPDAFHAEGSASTVTVAAAPTELLECLRVCAAHLPRPERPSSLFSDDHLTLASPQGGEAESASPLSLGDVLVSVLGATPSAGAGAHEDGGEEGRSGAWEVVGAVVFHGYGRRPLSALAAVAIAGVSAPRGRNSGGDDDAEMLVSASRALCVAATFVKAVAVEAGGADDEEHLRSAERDLVAVFPAAMLAVTSDNKGLREAGLLFISTVAAHGDALCAASNKGGKSAQDKKRTGTASKGGSSVDSEAEDSELFPVLERRGEAAAKPSSLCLPTLESVVELARALGERNAESGLGGGELPRHLAALLAGGGVPADSGSALSSSSSVSLSRYLVAWAARLGWRNPSASARLLECLAWAKASLIECCLPLLQHCLDSEDVRDDAESARLLKLLLSVTLASTSGDNGDTPSRSPPGGEPSSNTPGKSRGKGKDKDKGNTSSSATITVTQKPATPPLVFHCPSAEALLHRSLRTPGQVRTFALQALGSFSSSAAVNAMGGVGEGEGGAGSLQRRELLSTLVDVGLDGGDGSLIASAASALGVMPGDVAALVGGLVPSGEREGGGGDGGRHKKKRKQTTTTTGWVSKLGGVVELAQALCGPSYSSADRSGDRSSRRKKGHTSSAGGPRVDAAESSGSIAWRGSAALELANPLFDALPSLLSAAQSCSPSSSPHPRVSEAGAVAGASEGDVAAVEYALWLTMDVLGAVLRRREYPVVSASSSPNDGRGKGLYDGSRAGEDAERVLSCVRENPSPQTRNSGLALLSRMATLFPAAMASRLRSLLGAVCEGATTGEGSVGGGGRAALRQTQKAVQSVVPALRAHGAEVGVGAHLVVQVFVDALGDAPVHARRLLFGTLVDSLGDESLAVLSALLLRRAVTVEEKAGLGGKKKRRSEEEDASSTLVEFAHQTVHCSGGQAQVRALVGLVQACRRLSVFTAEKSGSLSGRSLEDALEQLSAADDGGEQVQEKEGGYLSLDLSLDQTRAAAEEQAVGDTSNSSPGSKNAFMTMDLRALAELSGAEVEKSGDEGGGIDRAAAVIQGVFLEKVLAFVRDHLVSKPLLMTVAASAERDGEAGGDGVQEGFLLLCEELLLLLRTLAACENGAIGNGPSWTTLQGLGYSVFETLQSLLSVPSFVAVTQELLGHQDPHLRRKALQMFTRRLDPAAGGAAPRLSPGEESLFVEMVPSLRMVAMGRSTRSPSSGGDGGSSDMESDSNLEEVMGPTTNEEEAGEESAVNRQTALLSLDVLARVLGRRHQAAFVGVVDDVTEIVAGVGPAALPGIGEAGAEGILPLRASAFLLLATLCAVLGVRAFPHLPRFFPAMLHALEHHSKQQPLGGAKLATASAPLQENGGAKAAGVSGGGGGSLLWTSSLSAVATVAASLPSFLSPYLGRIMAVALRAADGRGSVLKGGDGGSVAPGGGTQAADRVLSLLASGVEPRLLVPAVCASYSGCLEEGVAAGGGQVVETARKVARLLAYVQEILSGLEKEAASAALPQLSRLLTEALDFRRVHASGSAPEVRTSADLVEAEASSAMVSLVMRLSEVELRPLFLHLCEWKAAIAADDGSKEATLGGLDRRLSFYRVLDGLSAALKSIFTPYFAHVLTDCCDDMEAASLLATTATDGPSSASSSAKRKREAKDEARRKRRKKEKEAARGGPTDMSEDEDEGDATTTTTAEVRWRRAAAARLVLSAMRSCFQSDRSGFVDKARFEMIMPAVVSQLECGSSFPAEAASSATRVEGAAVEVDEVASCRRHAEELVGPCLAQLAAASGKDALWKALASAVLMRTRSKRAGVRVAALVSLRQCFEVVGEEFLSLLPECLPFLSELLEDGHPEVESECRALIKYIEGILGESIESYLV